MFQINNKKVEKYEHFLVIRDFYKYPDEIVKWITSFEAVHHKHPCTQWTMRSDSNYRWHHDHFCALCDEYTYRYGKVHKTDRLLRGPLWALPRNIKSGPLTPFELAMKSNPECIELGDPVEAYQAFYQTKQHRFKMVWTKRDVPEWFKYANVHS